MKTKLLVFLMGIIFSSSIQAQSSSRLDLAKSEFMKKNTKLVATDLDDILKKDEHLSSTSGITHSYYQQRINGIEVFGAAASLHTESSGKVVRVNNQLIPDLASKTKVSSPVLTSIQAVKAIANKMKYGATGKLKIVSQDKGPQMEMVISAGNISLSDIPTKLVYYPTNNGDLRLAWNFSIQELNDQNWWEFIVDAETGDLLKKINRVITCDWGKDESHVHHNHAHHAAPTITEQDIIPSKTEIAQEEKMEEPTRSWGYKVYAMPLESPYYGSRTMEYYPYDFTASPYGWHDTNGATGAEYFITRGNNVHAYEDGDNPGYSPTASGLKFNFPINTTYSNADQSEDAVITNLFYWNNIIHDVIYQYGFDEASGNFQENNYGNGGVGGDGVNAEAQDASGTCNANFTIVTEGNNPRMQMYICGAQDGDIDNLVIVHEYGHGISTRLTGGANNPYCLFNEEQMGEGWSDWYGLMLTMDANDSGADARGVGTYLFNQGPNGNGIRPYPYSTNMTVNPQTYDDIKNSSSSHYIGSVWATMLWEMTWGLINYHGFDDDFYNGSGGNNIALNLVTEALKLQGCSPGFIDGRDAILAADAALYNGANYCIIWKAFARRGLGVSANQGNPDNHTDGTEAFNRPYACRNEVRLDNSNQEEIAGNQLTNFPNPFTKSTMITYTLEEDAVVNLQVTDIAGRLLHNLVVDEQQIKGTHQVEFKVGALPAGLYLYTLKTGDQQITKQMAITH